MRVLPLFLLLPVTFAFEASVVVPMASTPILGRYIVRMKTQDLEKNVKTALKQLKKGPAHVHDFGNFGGFAVEMSDTELEALRHSPGVCFPNSRATLEMY